MEREQSENAGRLGALLSKLKSETARCQVLPQPLSSLLLLCSASAPAPVRLGGMSTAHPPHPASRIRTTTPPKPGRRRPPGECRTDGGVGAGGAGAGQVLDSERKRELLAEVGLLDGTLATLDHLLPPGPRP